MDKIRIKWIDILKGIGIVLVVVGHANFIFANATTAMFIQKYIYSFHMPLFFFLSGYLFVKEKYPSFKKLIHAKVKTLLVPYFLFSILSLIVYVIYGLTHKYKLIEFKTMVIQILYLTNKVVWNEVLWFLVCLFVVEAMFYSLPKTKAKFTLVFCAIVGCALSFTTDYFILPWGVGVAFTAIVFYGIGNLIKNTKIENKITSPNIVIFIICFTTNAVIGGVLNTIVYMSDTRYGNFIYFYIAAITGIVAYIQISQFFSKYNLITKALEYLGKNSIVIVGTHYIVFFIIQKIGRLNSLFKNNMPIKGYVYALITLLISIPIIFIINRYFPLVIGRKKSNAKINNKQNVSTT